jgi:hypothetical protein
MGMDAAILSLFRDSSKVGRSQQMTISEIEVMHRILYHAMVCGEMA